MRVNLYKIIIALCAVFHKALPSAQGANNHQPITGATSIVPDPGQALRGINLSPSAPALTPTLLQNPTPAPITQPKDNKANILPLRRRQRSGANASEDPGIRLALPVLPQSFWEYSWKPGPEENLETSQRRRYVVEAVQYVLQIIDQRCWGTIISKGFNDFSVSIPVEEITRRLTSRYLSQPDFDRILSMLPSKILIGPSGDLSFLNRPELDSVPIYIPPQYYLIAEKPYYVMTSPIDHRETLELEFDSNYENARDRIAIFHNGTSVAERTRVFGLSPFTPDDSICKTFFIETEQRICRETEKSIIKRREVTRRIQASFDELFAGYGDTLRPEQRIGAFYRLSPRHGLGPGYSEMKEVTRDLLLGPVEYSLPFKEKVKRSPEPPTYTVPFSMSYDIFNSEKHIIEEGTEGIEDFIRQHPGITLVDLRAETKREREVRLGGS
jgi:hypothetical protein